MKNNLHSKKGFTLVEVLFVSIISVMVLGAIISTWMFTHRAWKAETAQTYLRVDLAQALETIKSDIRLSSLTYIAFYPDTGSAYTAVSLPVAETDANGFFRLTANNEIDWDKTVIYHIFTEADGTKTLRRTVFDPRDNTMDEDAMYAQLTSVVTLGVGGAGSQTDTEFLKNVDTFEIAPLSPVINFYDESAVPIKVGKIVFGWAKLNAGSHTIRFEITGKNPLSSGYAIGIDNIIIEPSGSFREAEYYNSLFAPVGSFIASGGTAGRVHDPLWDNDNYLEFAATGVGSYMEIVDYYDLWRESAFESAALSNIEKIEEEVRIGLEVPEEAEQGEITWFAYVEAGDSEQEGHDANLPQYPIAIRTIVSNANIDREGDLIRVRFKSSSGNPLKIDRAYITRRNTAGDGLANVDPTGLAISEYHMHQQLFFKDVYDMDGDGSTSDIVEFVYIPPDSEAWSEWTAFPLVLKDAASNNVDYFITFCVPDLENVTWPAGWTSFDSLVTNCKLWNGSGIKSYYKIDDYATAAGTPVWNPDLSSYTEVPTGTPNIYVTANIDIWKKTGTVESQIFDTTVTAPAYNQIKWSENRPAGTGILLKARSSASKYMEGAAAWDLVAGSAVNPHALDIGNGRYVQFLAELSTDLFWSTTGSQLTYEGYIEDQLTRPVYEFPEYNGEYLTTGASSTWIDDVEIDWPGEERICTITGYIARKNSYGQAKVTIDGAELLRILSVRVKLLKDTPAGAKQAENIIEIKPRNTGK